MAMNQSELVLHMPYNQSEPTIAMYLKAVDNTGHFLLVNYCDWSDNSCNKMWTDLTYFSRFDPTTEPTVWSIVTLVWFIHGIN